MTGLDVAEPQPLWFSLQHTPPSLGISDTPAHAAAGAAGAAVEPAHTAAGSAHAAVGAAGSFAEVAHAAAALAEAGLQLHPFDFQFPLVESMIP